MHIPSISTVSDSSRLQNLLFEAHDTTKIGSSKAYSERKKLETAFFGGLCKEGHTIAWDFGDGAIAQGTLTPTHVYLLSGVYTVSLTVTDDSGFAISDTLQVTVDAPGDFAGLISLLDNMYSAGQVTNHGVYQSLLEKLVNAQKDQDSEKPDQAIKKLQDFQKQVDKETGKHIHDGGRRYVESRRC